MLRVATAGCALLDAHTAAAVAHQILEGVSVLVHVDSVVLAREHDWAVVHETDIEALRVLYLRLERVYELALLREYSQVEVVVVVRHQDLVIRVYSDSDRIVRYSY